MSGFYSTRREKIGRIFGVFFDEEVPLSGHGQDVTQMLSKRLSIAQYLGTLRYEMQA
jgi:hypothetical protein